MRPSPRHRAPRPTRRTLRRLGAGTIVTGLVAALTTILSVPAESAPIVPFTSVYHDQINGQIALVGNTVLSCQTAAAGCADARADDTPATTTQINGVNDNDFSMAYVDTDSNAATFNSSSSVLTLPNQADVQFAALVWQGRPPYSGNGSGVKNQMKLQVPGSSTYQTVTANRVDNTGSTDGANSVYSSYANVTSIVKAAGAGTYVGADVATAIGTDRWGGWSLVVAYRQSALPLRDLSIFSGFEAITSSTGADNFSISGFKAPPNGEVRARIGVVAGDGDQGYVGDQAQVNGTALSSDVSGVNNFFNSTNDVLGTSVTTRNPAYRNNLGWDVKDIAAPGTIPNGATTATVSLTTGGESYYPSVLTTAIDLYAPNFNSTSKTVTNLSGHSPTVPGDTLQYTLSFTNTGGDPATNAVLRDPLPADVTYVPGSLRVTDGANAGAKTDAAGDDQGEYDAGARLVRVRVGTGASATAGGTLTPSSASATTSTTTASFRVLVNPTAAGSTITNTGLLDYRAQTLGKDFTFTGNSVATPVGTLADLALTGTAPATVSAGNPATYDFTVTNKGPTAAADTVFTATLPAGLTATSVTTSTGATCTVTGQVVTCPLGSVANGAAPTVRVVGRVGAGVTATTLSVTGQVTASTADPDASNNTLVLSNGVAASSDLAVTNTGPATLVPGRRATYTVTVTNNGPSDAAGVGLTDTLPADLTFVSIDDATCTQSAGTVTCPIGALAAGATRTYQVVAALAPGYTGTTVSTTASASGSTADPTPANNTATASTTVASPVADLQITGTATPTGATAGTNQQFGYTVRNNGPSDAADAVVTVPVPDGTTYVSVTSRTGSCTLSDDRQTATCRVGTVPANGTTAVLLTVKVDPATTAALASTAAVASPTTDPATGNNTARVTAAVTARADLAVQLVGDDPTLSGGEDESYTLTTTNNGPASARGVVTTQTLPAGFTTSAGRLTVPAGTTCVVTGGSTKTVTCSTDRLDPGDSVVVTVPATAPGTLPASVESTATVSATTTDPNTDNNTAVFDLTGANSADLQVTLDDSPDPVVAGGTITYVATVHNNGPATAVGARFADDLSALLDGANAVITTSAGSCDPPSAAVRCTLGSIASRDTVTVRIVVPVKSGTTAAVPNTASVASDTDDPTMSNNAATVSTDVVTRADIAVTQDVPATVDAGRTLNYSISVVNSGPSDAASVRVKEPLPAGFVFRSASGATCTAPGGVLTCVLDTVRAGEPARTIDVIVDVDPNAPSGAATLAVTGSTTTPQSDTGNDADSDAVTVTRLADVRITGTLSPDPVVAGRNATAEFTVVNRGPSTTTGSTVRIPVPAGTTLVSAATTSGSCTLDDSGDPDVVVCTLAALDPNAPVTVDVVLAVASDALGTLAVPATVSAPDDPSDSTATPSAPITTQADLGLQITTSTDPVTAGSGFVYSFVVANAGPSDAANVVLTGQLPVGVSPLKIDAPPGVTCTPGAQRRITCTVASIPAGTSRVGALTVSTDPSLADGTKLVNTAQVSSDTPDATTDDNTASVTTNIVTAAAISVRQSALPGTVVVPGEPYSYRFTVSNSGPSDAKQVRIVDTLPPGVTADRASTPQGMCTVADGPDDNSIITCDLGTLDAGAIVVNVYGVVLDPSSTAATITNNAVVTSPTPATPGGPAQSIPSSLQLPVQPVADLVMTKTASAASLAAGSPVTYTLRVANPTGPSDAASTTITDVVPSAIGNVQVAAPTGTDCTKSAGTDGTTVTCTTGAVPVGDDVTVTVTGTLRSSALETVVVNTASVVGPSDPDTDNNSDSASITVTRSADLSVQVTPVAATATPGTDTSYRVTVTNGGPSDADAPSVTIPVPDGLRDVDITLADGSDARCTRVTGGFRCPATDPGADTLGAGSSVVLVVSGTIDPAATGTLDERASVGTTTTDPTGSNDSDDRAVPLVSRADIVATKSVDPDVLVPGGTATYTVTARNTGPSVAHAVTVVDDLQTGQTPGDATLSGADGTCTTSGQRVSCTIPTLAVGATATVTIPVTVASGFDGTAYSNTATVSSPDETDPSDNVPQVSGPTAPKADLSVTAAARPQDVGQDDGTAVPGTRVAYDLTVRNDGPSDAPQVRLTDTLPAGATIVSAGGDGWTCDTSATPLVCTRTSLDSGDTAPVLTVVVDLPSDAAGRAASTVAVSSGVADPATADNTDRVVLPLQAFSDLVTDKTVTPAVPTAGGTATYVVTTRNDGPSDAPDVVLTDALQDGQRATGVRLTGADGDCTIDAGASAGTGGIVRCSLDDPLADGDTVTMTIDVAFASDYAAGTFTNTAAATSPARGQSPGADIDAVSGPVARQADLSVTKAGPRTATPGGTVTWTITVANAGPSEATDVVVLDALPAGVSATSADGDVAGTSCTLGSTVTCTVPTVAAGAKATVTIVATVASGATGTLVNRATAIAGNSVDPVDTDNTSDPVETTLVRAAALTVVKTATPTTLVAGQDAHYDVVVTSSGQSDATDVVVTDPMPDGVTATAATIGGGGTCTVGATVRCTLAELNAGSSVTVGIDVRISPRAAGTITNVATATSPDAPADGVGRVTSPVTPLAFLEVSKTASRSRVVVGDLVTYTVGVRNTGTAAATGVVVDDRLPAGLRFVSAAAEQGRYVASTGQWRVGTVKVDATLRLRITAEVTAAGRIVNIAAIDPDTPGVTDATRPDPAPAPVTGVDGSGQGPGSGGPGSGAPGSGGPGSGGPSDGAGGDNGDTDGSTADTGTRVAQGLGVAALLLAVGFGLLVGGRRRREPGRHGRS